MGGNKKFRALRLDHGNFGWASEGISKTTRIVDAAPFRSHFENHYAQALGRKKNHVFTDEEKAAIEKTANCSEQTKKKYLARQAKAAVAPNLNSQFLQGKLLGMILSRPGQCGRADGRILEGDELDFYVKKLKTKKSKA